MLEQSDGMGFSVYGRAGISMLKDLCQNLPLRKCSRRGWWWLVTQWHTKLLVFRDYKGRLRKNFSAGRLNWLMCYY
jgi:hypothetical protein